jgi:diguanylate cyclase (GGDEF)-like protein
VSTLIADAPIGPLLAIPLVAGPQGLGLLAVARRAGSQAFDEEDEGLVQQLAQHAMTAVQNARHEAERERARAQLTRQATTDPLTDLANRALLVHRLGEALTRSGQGARTIAILFLDLDNFKTINDTHGHVVGDRLLVQVAERLLACVRSADTVCRLGGDEFAILLEAANGVTEAETVAARILEALRLPVTVEGKELLVQASIGIAERTPGALEQSVELLRNADVAMYKAKADGKARYVVFEPEMHSTMLERLALESDLRLAVQRQEFLVHYQPIFSLETGRPIALEALVRWQHPERGLLPPGDFIPLAEQTGLIVPIGWWVLEQACRQARQWHEQFPTEPALVVAVNLAPVQLVQAGLRDGVARILRESGLDASHLVLEITESTLMKEDHRFGVNLRELKALGLRLAIDDFGTGYSSLSRLRSFPVDILKIDRSFVQEITSEAERAPMVAAILAMARGMKLQVVAEGVETAEQLVVLRRYGCDQAQGFLLARPSDTTRTEDFLRRLGEEVHAAEPPGAAANGAGLLDAKIIKALSNAVTAAPSDLEPFTRFLLEEVGRVTGLDSTFLTRIHWDRDQQEVLYSYNVRELKVPEGDVVAWSDTLCRRALSGGPNYTDDVPNVYPESAAARELRLRTYVSVPVVDSKGEIFGTLCGASRSRRQLGQGAMQTMELLARILGYLMDRHQLGEAAQPKVA